MKNGPFENVFPIKMVIFHGYVSLPACTPPTQEQWKVKVQTRIVTKELKMQ